MPPDPPVTPHPRTRTPTPTAGVGSEPHGGPWLVVVDRQPPRPRSARVEPRPTDRSLACAGAHQRRGAGCLEARVGLPRTARGIPSDRGGCPEASGWVSRGIGVGVPRTARGMPSDREGVPRHRGAYPLPSGWVSRGLLGVSRATGVGVPRHQGAYSTAFGWAFRANRPACAATLAACACALPAAVPRRSVRPHASNPATLPPGRCSRGTFASKVSIRRTG